MQPLQSISHKNELMHIGVKSKSAQIGPPDNYNHIFRCRYDSWFKHRSHNVILSPLIEHLIRQSTKFGGWDHIAQGVLDLAMALFGIGTRGFGRGGGGEICNRAL